MNDTPSISQIEKEEKEKYSNLWKTDYIPSQSAIPLADYISQFNKNWKLLDIGCGNGITAGLLRKKGFNCFGVDITLDGIKDKECFYEAPAWRLPFEDNEFDFTFSTDVLEHLPTDLVDKTIKEIFRVTKIKTFHCIATFFVSTDVKGGVILHQTVKPIKWWREKFERLNAKKLDLKVMDRKDFLSG